MSDFSPNDPEKLPQKVDLMPRDAPPTPPSPEEAETDFKSSRKREREVSLEPATPKTDDAAEEQRKPAPKKKNRMSDSLETTHEEDEAITPPDSPNKLRPEDDPELSTSPPYETKVKQISRKVKGMKWDDRERDQSLGSTIEYASQSTQDTTNLGPAVEIDDKTPSPPPDAFQQSDEEEPLRSAGLKDDVANPPPDTNEGQTGDSDSDDQDKKLKRKIGDRMPSVSLEDAPAKRAGPNNENTKRSRDSQEDENPREKKRPSPPPEAKDASSNDKGVEEESATAPQTKVGGFLAYAANSSPFASAKGPSVFGQKSTPSPSPLAGTSNGNASSFASAFGMKPSSPFAIANTNKPASSSVFGSTSSSSTFGPNGNGQSHNALSTSPTGTKRSGFEAFAAASSPFAAASRSKSPPSVLGGFARSKSPPRRGSSTSVTAFNSYVGMGSQGFSAPSPPVKKQRQDSADDTAEDSKPASGSKLGSANGSAEGSEEEAEKTDRPVSFRDQLRATSNVLDGREGSEEDDRPVVTEQEVQTGEEEEDTVFQVRGKLYALSTQNSWKERGTGLLKLNVRKSDGGGARLVMRKEAVYALLLNVTLFKGMRCTLAQDPRYVRFSCIEGGATVHYNLRLSNAKVSAELIEEITANIPGDEAEPEPAV